MKLMEFAEPFKLDKKSRATFVSEGVEPSSDLEEMEAILVRAMRYSWPSSVFTHAEMQERLAINELNPGLTPKALKEWFDEIVDREYQHQQEAAKSAQLPLPVLIWFENRTGGSYRGIAQVVRRQQAPAETPQLSQEVVRNSTEYTLPTPPEAPRTQLSAVDIARIAFHLLLQNSTNQASDITSEMLYQSVRSTGAPLNPASVRKVINTLVETGYVTSFATKKGRRHLLMPPEVREEVQSSVEDGSFNAGLEYIFGAEPEVARPVR